jgi:hypothetical protein
MWVTNVGYIIIFVVDNINIKVMASIILRLGHYSKKELEPNKTHSIYLNYKQGREFEFRASTKIKTNLNFGMPKNKP